MWLAKPVYEALPYYYVAIGVAALAARLYVDWWYWPVICTAVGVLGIAGGALVWLRRRRSRRSE
jgi:Flp pilus assembly protein TadB